MALRVANKINRQALQNICKSLYSGSSESTYFPRSSSNDASTATSTITSTGSTIHANNNKANVLPSANVTVAPPTTPVTNPPPSANSMQCSSYSNQNQTPNTPTYIDNNEFSSQDQFDKESDPSKSMKNCPPPLPSLSAAYQVCPTRSKSAPTHYIPPTRNQFNKSSYNKTTQVVNPPTNMTHLQPGNQAQIYAAEKKGVSPFQASAEALREAVEQGGSTQWSKEPSASETNGGYRKFEESMTYRNLTQPLKLSRLASPFPEPIKEMPSRRITDQEKSTQMFAKSRSSAVANAHFEQHQRQLRLKPKTPIQPSFVRHYTDKAFGRAQTFTVPPVGKYKPKKVTVKKLKTDKPCPPGNKSTMCKDHRYVFKPCTKKETPYPSYSEYCHEEKPFVCRTCPWMDETHPAFKPKKKNYHTTSRAMSISSGLTTSLEANSVSSCNMQDVDSASDSSGSNIAVELKKQSGRRKPDCEPNNKLKRVPCAWVELDKKEDWLRSIAPSKNKKSRQSNVAKKNIASKKPPCEPKSRKRCPPSANQNLPPKVKKCASQYTKTLATASQTAHKEDTATTGPHVYHQCDDVSQLMPTDVATPAVCQSIDEWLAGLRPNKVETHCNVAVVTSGGPCKKFPFKPLAFDLVINRIPKMRNTKCPKKPKKPIIVDCPQRPVRSDDRVAQFFDNAFLCKKKSGGKKFRKEEFKCPQNDEESSSKHKKDHPADGLLGPCKSKRKPESEVCPDDLLTRRRKDKPWKKAASNENDFQEAITMLNSIEKAKSAPTLFTTPYNFRQQ